MPVALRKDPRGPILMLLLVDRATKFYPCPKYINPRFVF